MPTLMPRFLVLCSIPMVLLQGVNTARPSEQPKLSLLIVDGMNNHDWPRATKILKEILEGKGRVYVTIKQFEPQASHLASRGMVAARADYRVKSRHGVTPRLDAEGEDAKVSSTPNALVLFNPVLRFSGIGQLMQRIGNDDALGKAISPTLHLKKDSPPTLIFFGTADRLAPMGEEFMKKSKELGHWAELFTAEGQPHGFFNRPPWLEKTTQRMDEFLVSLGYLEGKATAKRS